MDIMDINEIIDIMLNRDIMDIMDIIDIMIIPAWMATAGAVTAHVPLVIDCLETELRGDN